MTGLKAKLSHLSTVIQRELFDAALENCWAQTN
jgi:hypothetical protein